MNDDPRCCGTGTCIIDPEGRCWCGQQWDGEKMCHVPLSESPSPSGKNVLPATSPTPQETSRKTPDRT